MKLLKFRKKTERQVTSSHRCTKEEVIKSESSKDKKVSHVRHWQTLAKYSIELKHWVLLVKN